MKWISTINKILPELEIKVSLQLNHKFKAHLLYNNFQIAPTSNENKSLAFFQELETPKEQKEFQQCGEHQQI
jgi:hypothetical protein